VVHSATAARLVLVVDDFDDTRELYATALADAGFAVAEAMNGQEALDRVARVDVARPALIVMDLSMPVVDGWEATRRLKADPATSDIIVIALTGHSTNLGLEKARTAGADAVLAKPCLPHDLVALVKALLR
jgi:two-component system, cell cycle response regulator DivK